MSEEKDSPELSASMEEYLTTLRKLERERRVVKVRDVAVALSVSHPSVSVMLKRLSEMGYVEREQYSYVALTGVGRERADTLARRERVLYEFLTRVLLVTAEQARRDACAIEHAISDEAVERLVRFIEQLFSAPCEQACLTGPPAPDAPPQS